MFRRAEINPSTSICEWFWRADQTATRWNNYWLDSRQSPDSTAASYRPFTQRKAELASQPVSRSEFHWTTWNVLFYASWRRPSGTFCSGFKQKTNKTTTGGIIFLQFVFSMKETNTNHLLPPSQRHTFLIHKYTLCVFLTISLHRRANDDVDSSNWMFYDGHVKKKNITKHFKTPHTFCDCTWQETFSRCNRVTFTAQMFKSTFDWLQNHDGGQSCLCPCLC